MMIDWQLHVKAAMMAIIAITLPLAASIISKVIIKYYSRYNQGDNLKIIIRMWYQVILVLTITINNFLHKLAVNYSSLPPALVLQIHCFVNKLSHILGDVENLIVFWNSYK